MQIIVNILFLFVNNLRKKKKTVPAEHDHFLIFQTLLPLSTIFQLYRGGIKEPHITKDVVLRGWGLIA